MPAEPSRLLVVPFADLPQSVGVGRGGVPADSNFFVVVGHYAYGYAYDTKAAALAYWRAAAHYVSDVVASDVLSYFVFDTDAAYIAGAGDSEAAYDLGFADGVASVPAGEYDRLSALDCGAGFTMDGTGLLATIKHVGGVRVSARSTRGHMRGGYFCELTQLAHAGAVQSVNFGLGTQAGLLTEYPGGTAASIGWDSIDGIVRSSNSQVAAFATWTDGDTIGLYHDFEAELLHFYKNGVAAGAAIAWSGHPSFVFVGPGYIAGNGTVNIRMNFGATAFSMAVPGGAAKW